MQPVQVDYQSPLGPPVQPPISRLAIISILCPVAWVTMFGVINSLTNSKVAISKDVLQLVGFLILATPCIGTLLSIVAIARLRWGEDNRRGYGCAVPALVFNLPAALLTVALCLESNAWAGIKG